MRCAQPSIITRYLNGRKGRPLVSWIVLFSSFPAEKKESYPHPWRIGNARHFSIVYLPLKSPARQVLPFSSLSKHCACLLSLILRRPILWILGMIIGREGRKYFTGDVMTRINEKFRVSKGKCEEFKETAVCKIFL